MTFALLALALLPQVSHIVVAPAETLRVEVRGAGAPVVLVPGFFGSAHTWRHVVARLTTQQHRTIVVEPLGLGGSSRPRAANYSLTAQADRIAAVLDTLGVTDAVVVAHAIGAGMAYRLALRRPELVRGIVSIEGGPAETAATPGLRRAMSMAPLIRLLGGPRLIRGRVRSSLIRASGDSSWVTEQVVREYTAAANADLGATLLAYIGMVNSRERFALRPRLGELRAPVVLLMGGAPHEGGLPETEANLLRAGVPAFERLTVAGSGLYVQEERPEAVTGAVERLIAGIPRTLVAAPR